MSTSTVSATPFVSAETLAAELAGQGGTAVIHVAADAGRSPPDARIASAVLSDLPTHFAGPGGGAAGRLPLPAPEAVRGWLSQAGLLDRPLVVYDHDAGTAAARAWWVLTWAGVASVRILDGGWRAWQAWEASGASPATTVGPIAGAVALPLPLPVGTDDLASRLPSYRLFDARGLAAYQGPADAAQASHIPGAVSSPVSQWQDADGRLLPRVTREAHARALGLYAADDRPLVAYCGAGVAAAYWVAAVADLGIGAHLYPGSWSAWSSDPGRLRPA